jgi:superfamily II DNA or RNA helicase
MEYTAQGTPRTKTSIFMRLVNKAKIEKRAAEVLQPAEEIRDQSLFPHQQRVLDKMWAAGRGCNWVVVAPTGTGKTRIFVEYARWGSAGSMP